MFPEVSIHGLDDQNKRCPGGCVCLDRPNPIHFAISSWKPICLRIVYKKVIDDHYLETPFIINSHEFYIFITLAPTPSLNLLITTSDNSGRRIT